MADLHLGTEIAGYRIEAYIARGGMGVIYRAVQIELDLPVVLKVIVSELADDIAFRERFKREARLAASIDHPNVIPIHYAGEERGVLFITMRYVRGTDLMRVLSEQGALDVARAVRVVGQVAAALDAAHERGLVHRDVKPANVLLEDQSGREHVYLSDFGLAKRPGTGAGLTSTGEIVGTVDYMAPEQIRAGMVDARADVYALACVLYQSLTGNIPFPRDSEVAKIYAHLETPPPRPSETELRLADFDEVVTRGMAKDQSRRFQSAGDLASATRAAALGEESVSLRGSVARGEAAPTRAPADGPSPASPLLSPTERLGPPPSERASPGRDPESSSLRLPVSASPSGSSAGETRPMREQPSEPRRPGATAPAVPAAPPRRRKLALAIVAALAVAAGLVAVAIQAISTDHRQQARAGDQNAQGRRGTVAGRTLTIYSSLPRRGPERAYTDDMVRAEKLALAQSRSRAGRFRLLLKSLDATANGTPDPDKVRSNARQAVGDPTTIAYLGDFHSESSMASMPILNRAGILQVSPTNTYEGLTRHGAQPNEPAVYAPSGKRTYARVVPADHRQAVAAATWMREMGITEVFLVDDRGPAGATLARLFVRAARKVDIRVVGRKSINPAEDYRMLARQIASSGAEAMFFAGGLGGEILAARLWRDVSAVNPGLRLFGSDQIANSTFTSQIRNLTADMYITSPPLGKDKYPQAALEFFQAFQKKYKHCPGQWGIFAYEAMQAVLDSLSRAGRNANDPRVVIDSFFSISRRRSVLGTYSISASGDTTLPSYGGYKVSSGGRTFNRVLGPSPARKVGSIAVDRLGCRRAGGERGRGSLG